MSKRVFLVLVALAIGIVGFAAVQAAGNEAAPFVEVLLVPTPDREGPQHHPEFLSAVAECAAGDQYKVTSTVRPDANRPTLTWWIESPTGEYLPDEPQVAILANTFTRVEYYSMSVPSVTETVTARWSNNATGTRSVTVSRPTSCPTATPLTPTATDTPEPTITNTPEPLPEATMVPSAECVANGWVGTFIITSTHNQNLYQVIANAEDYDPSGWQSDTGAFTKVTEVLGFAVPAYLEASAVEWDNAAQTMQGVSAIAERPENCVAPTSTPEPSLTPEPTSEPSITPEPTVEPTATDPAPTETPSGGDGTGTPEPSATNTDIPSVTLTPSLTAQASQTPQPTSTEPPQDGEPFRGCREPIGPYSQFGPHVGEDANWYDNATGEYVATTPVKYEPGMLEGNPVFLEAPYPNMIGWTYRVVTSFGTFIVHVCYDPGTPQAEPTAVPPCPTCPPQRNECFVEGYVGLRAWYHDARPAINQSRQAIVTQGEPFEAAGFESFNYESIDGPISLASGWTWEMGDIVEDEIGLGTSDFVTYESCSIGCEWAIMVLADGTYAYLYMYGATAANLSEMIRVANPDMDGLTALAFAISISVEFHHWGGQNRENAFAFFTINEDGSVEVVDLNYPTSPN